MAVVSLVPFHSVDDLMPAMQEVAVSTYLENAKNWLATAVERTGPEQIANARAEIATAAEATKQYNLSKEIQLDSQEMLRRAEYTLGKAIRKGQADGSVAGEHDHGGPAVDYVRHGRVVHVADRLREEKPKSPKDIVGAASHSSVSALYRLSDDVEPEAFDAAVEAAKAEGDLTRANVVRKINKQDGPESREQRADLIAELAARGYTSRQMPKQVGVTEETVRQIARDFGIEIPADKTVGNTRRANSNDIAGKTVTALEGLVMGVELIDYAELDPVEARQWVASLTDSLRVLNRFAKQIKETSQ